VTATIAYPRCTWALATKTVDGQDNPIGNTWAAKFYQVQKHEALTKHIYATIVFAASPKAWDRLFAKSSGTIVTGGGAPGRERGACRGPAQQESAYLAGQWRRPGSR